MDMQSKTEADILLYSSSSLSSHKERMDRWRRWLGVERWRPPVTAAQRPPESRSSARRRHLPALPLVVPSVPPPPPSAPPPLMNDIGDCMAGSGSWLTSERVTGRSSMCLPSVERCYAVILELNTDGAIK